MELTELNLCRTHFQDLLLDLHDLLSLACSYPIYSLYIIFFSPYLLRALFFLSPLLLSTSLFLLILISITPQQKDPPQESHHEHSPSSPYISGFLPNVSLMVVSLVRAQLGEKVEIQLLQVLDFIEAGLRVSEEELSLESLEAVLGVSEEELSPESQTSSIGEEDMGNVERESGKLGDGGASNKSMRREKEWKRTLACRLFEEKQNKWRETLGGKLIVDGFGVSGEESGEGMDILWEVYEDTVKKGEDLGAKSKRMVLNSKGKIRGKEGKIRALGRVGGFDLDRSDEEEEEEEDDEPQLCCLNALRFSTGKMSFGLRRPNLMKISKALKGFGLLHHVSPSKKPKP
ncbi:uncharacterized protein LOC18438225 [Amborella trichopoda]|uniref:Uncharacterized protein n=1 Tax=Amborella trichopoda TaxID=13333 RepID=W1PPQ9_AMBTC|nr:uncharacterized protein LOC18438225 [Amborella trichopoda]ERN10058.1 hypothetical protein AMTR_s00013p00253200 [Amborella trichopoda]|eukprot:XP_006848477.1 uncharacterized protein LOC18438225 [Amborella trichopoda]